MKWMYRCSSAHDYANSWLGTVRKVSVWYFFPENRWGRRRCSRSGYVSLDVRVWRCSKYCNLQLSRCNGCIRLRQPRCGQTYPYYCHHKRAAHRLHLRDPRCVLRMRAAFIEHYLFPSSSFWRTRDCARYSAASVTIARISSYLQWAKL